jgi:fido (protein-threonine AMPylation protein)
VANGPRDGNNNPCVWWTGETANADEEARVIKGVDFIHAFILARAKTHLLNHGDLKTWHRKLFAEVVPVDYYAGNYRMQDPARPCLAWPVGVNGRPGTPYQQVPLSMEGYSDTLRQHFANLSAYLAGNPPSREKNRTIVKVLAWEIGEFIRIHPFVNGNGRVSRMLANYICQRYDLPLPFANPKSRPDLAAYEDASADAMIGGHQSLYIFFLQQLSIPRL